MYTLYKWSNRRHFVPARNIYTNDKNNANDKVTLNCRKILPCKIFDYISWVAKRFLFPEVCGLGGRDVKIYYSESHVNCDTSSLLF